MAKQSTRHQGPSDRSPRARRFPRPVLQAIDESKILGVRAGRPSAHRFIGIWAVVVDDRVFVRSWTLEPGGWNQAFRANPLGWIQVGERQIRIRAVPVRAERIRDAIERAYAAKYATPGALKYVRGFRTARRRNSTLEFLPWGQVLNRG
jgi:hypothetical protein